MGFQFLIYYNIKSKYLKRCVFKRFVCCQGHGVVFKHRSEDLHDPRASGGDICFYCKHVNSFLTQCVPQWSESPFCALVMFENIMCFFFGVDKIFWIFVYRIVGQVHEVFMEVWFVRSFIFNSAKTSKAFVANESLNRVYSNYGDINSQIELYTI